MQIQIPAEIFVCTWWSRLYPAAEATQLGRLYNESLAARWERRPTHLSYFLTTTNSTVPSPPSSSVLSYHCKPFFHEKRVLPHWLYSSPTPWLSSPLPASSLPYLTSDQLLTGYWTCYQPSRDLLSSLSSPFILSDMKGLKSLPPKYQFFAWDWTKGDPSPARRLQSVQTIASGLLNRGQSWWLVLMRATFNWY